MDTKSTVYFYHSKPEIDPKAKGQRVTVCCVIKDGRMSFAATKVNRKAKDSFSKSFGRKISEIRATKKPSLVLEEPENGAKILFIETSKEMVKKILAYGHQYNWHSFAERSLQKTKNAIKRNINSLKVLTNWVGFDNIDPEFFKELKVSAEKLLAIKPKEEKKPTASPII